MNQKEIKLLITGAFGGIGTALTETALKHGCSVSILELDTAVNRKKAAAFGEKPLRIFWGDLRDYSRVREAVEGHNAVIHLGAMMTPASEKHPETAYEINVGGTKNIIEAIKNSKSKPVLVFTSSMSIMGADPDRKPPLRINDPLIATSNYTAQKIECEKILKESDIEWTITRLGAVINTELSAGGGSLKEMMSEVFSMKLDNRIEGIWNIDAATALLNIALKLLESDIIKRKIFFIGGGNAKGWQLTVDKFYTSVFTAIGFGMLPKKYFSPEAYYADWLDTEESQRILDYQNHSFAEFTEALKKSLGIKRIFIVIFAPLIRWVLVKSAEKSDHFN